MLYLWSNDPNFYYLSLLMKISITIFKNHIPSIKWEDDSQSPVSYMQRPLSDFPFQVLVIGVFVN
jgi:hypothetical protein